MNIINLDTLEGIPIEFMRRLENLKTLFRSYDSLEKLQLDTKIPELIREINSYCIQNMVIGFHYCKAEPKEIAEKGLLKRSGSEIRNTFLEKYYYLFTDGEIELIKSKWEEYFSELQCRIRDNRIYFNFTRNALYNRSATLLQTYFGGEQIYMPIYSIQSIGEKLKRIGHPLILKCTINPQEITTFTGDPWGKIAISTFHYQQNQDISRFDIDGYQSEVIQPENIELLIPELI